MEGIAADCGNTWREPTHGHGHSAEVELPSVEVMEHLTTRLNVKRTPIWLDGVRVELVKAKNVEGRRCTVDIKTSLPTRNLDARQIADTLAKVLNPNSRKDKREKLRE